MDLKDQFWKQLYSHWNDARVARVPGYTIVIPVPGDLPVFLKIALEVCASQDPEHLCEILVIPDQLAEGFRERFEDWSKEYAACPVRLVNLRYLERWKNRVRPNGMVQHWLQFIRGVDAVRTDHALLHDADLFILEPRFMRTLYETCVERELACFGVSAIADPWYGGQGLHHLTATWELMFQVDWFTRFPPWQHRAHENRLNGKKHNFDATLFPQCQTPPHLIARYPEEAGFIHLKHVLATYRYFQKSKPPCEDEFFRLLLVRLLNDAYGLSGADERLPSLKELIQGTRDRTARVTFVRPETRANYPAFRAKLGQLLESGCLEPEKAVTLEAGARAFDQAFDCWLCCACSSLSRCFSWNAARHCGARLVSRRALNRRLALPF
jgi:hypothetical protein